MCLQCRVSRCEPQNFVQLLQCYVRAAELEVRAAEALLPAGLDVKGFRAQVLERLEVLEDRERERQALLTGLVTLAEEPWGQSKPRRPYRRRFGRCRPERC
jgi:hypothetical protein